MIWILVYFGYLDFGLLASDLVIKRIWIFDISWIWVNFQLQINRNQSNSVKISQITNACVTSCKHEACVHLVKL